MSREKIKSYFPTNHNNNINHAIAKCGASAIEKQHISNAVANPDIPGWSVQVNLALEMNRSANLVAAERPKVPKSVKNSLISRKGFN